MTETERKALALVNEVKTDCKGRSLPDEPLKAIYLWESLCRAIEQHEAYKREVSDAVGYAIPLIETWVGNSDEAGRKAADRLRRFIIPKPVDPLVEKVARALAKSNGDDPDMRLAPGDEYERAWQLYADNARAALAAMQEAKQ